MNFAETSCTIAMKYERVSTNKTLFLWVVVDVLKHKLVGGVDKPYRLLENK